MNILYILIIFITYSALAMEHPSEKSKNHQTIIQQPIPPDPLLGLFFVTSQAIEKHKNPPTIPKDPITNQYDSTKFTSPEEKKTHQTSESDELKITFVNPSQPLSQANSVPQKPNTTDRCQRCGFRKKNKHNFAAHERWHDEHERNPELSCDDCKLTFSDKYIIADHKKTCPHNTANIQPTQEMTPCPRQGCPVILPKAYIQAHALANHDLDETCYLCKKNFNSAKALEQHQEDHSPSLLL